MYVVTPRCAAAAAAVVSAVVLRRPTKEYTHRYSMMHRRLTTAGIEVAPHYHQFLVYLNQTVFSLHQTFDETLPYRQSPQPPSAVLSRPRHLAGI